MKQESNNQSIEVDTTLLRSLLHLACDDLQSYEEEIGTESERILSWPLLLIPEPDGADGDKLVEAGKLFVSLVRSLRKSLNVNRSLIL